MSSAKKYAAGTPESPSLGTKKGSHITRVETDGARGETGNMMKEDSNANVEPHQCVVCGRVGRDGQMRKSGWKCKKCVGSKATKALKACSSRREQMTNLMGEAGFATGQEVVARGFECKWGTGSGWRAARIANLQGIDSSDESGSGEEGWWSPGCTTIDVTWSDGSGVSTLRPDAVRPTTINEVVFRDARRLGYVILLIAGEGSVEIVSRAGKSCTCSKAKTIGFFRESTSLNFPELGNTARCWIPTDGKGWESLPMLLWRLHSLFEASGVKHDLKQPDVPFAAQSERKSRAERRKRLVARKQRERAEKAELAFRSPQDPGLRDVTGRGGRLAPLGAVGSPGSPGSPGRSPLDKGLVLSSVRRWRVVAAEGLEYRAAPGWDAEPAAGGAGLGFGAAFTTSKGADEDGWLAVLAESQTWYLPIRTKAGDVAVAVDDVGNFAARWGISDTVVTRLRALQGEDDARARRVIAEDLPKGTRRPDAAVMKRIREVETPPEGAAAGGGGGGGAAKGTRGGGGGAGGKRQLMRYSWRIVAPLGLTFRKSPDTGDAASGDEGVGCGDIVSSERRPVDGWLCVPFPDRGRDYFLPMRSLDGAATITEDGVGVFAAKYGLSEECVDRLRHLDEAMQQRIIEEPLPDGTRRPDGAVLRRVRDAVAACQPVRPLSPATSGSDLSGGDGAAAAAAAAAPGRFRGGQRVQVRDGPSQPWEEGVVTCERPLLVLIDGWDEPCPFVCVRHPGGFSPKNSPRNSPRHRRAAAAAPRNPQNYDDWDD